MDENRLAKTDKVIGLGRVRPQVVPEVAESPYFLEADGPYESASLREHWHTLLRRRWTVLTTLVIVTALVTIITFRMKPVYRGTARVEIDPEIPQLQSESSPDRQAAPTDDAFLRSQAQVLQADQLAWKTIEQLGLANTPGFIDDTKESETNSNVRKLRLIERFRKDLKVELIPQSRVVRVDFDSTNPNIAGNVPNNLVNNYIEYNFTEKYDSARQASGRMEQQLDELKAKVERSQQALVDYQREHAIAKVSEKQNLVEQTLGELSTDLTKAQGDRIQKEALSNLLHSDPSQIASLAQNEVVQKLEEDYANLSNQYTEALNQYGPNFPKVQRLRAQLQEADDQIHKERDRVFARISDDYNAALRRERLLSGEVARTKEELGNVNRLLVQQNILAGEFESNQKMYQMLLQRLKESTVSAGLRSTNVHAVDPALIPVKPVRPKKLEYILGGILAGLFVGMVLAFTQESIDSSLKNTGEAEAIVGAPALAVVPIAESRSAARLIRKYADQNRDGNPALAVLHQPNSPLAESFRSLRTSVLFRTGQTLHTMLVTSPNAGEGKTCTAINLAMALGQRGRSVVLVDCDLRRPSVARTLGLDGRRGLTTFLMGRHTLDQVLQKFEGVPALSILPAGPVAMSPSEILSSEMMASLVNALAEQFSYVILDTPPVLAVTDASVLSSLVDGVLLVVAGGDTPRVAAERSRKLLDLVGARIMGVVVNKIHSHEGSSYGYYGRRYAYGKEGCNKVDDTEIAV